MRRKRHYLAGALMAGPCGLLTHQTSRERLCPRRGGGVSHMLFFKRKPPLITIAALSKRDGPTEIKPVRTPSRKPDSDGRQRRINRVIEDNRLL